MAVANSLTQQAKKPTVQALIKSDAYQKNIAATLGDASKAKTFTSSVISAISTNPALGECSAPSIISAALLGESLKLSPSPQLGQYYMVPFNNKDGKVAQFQLGYKGYIQLAIRSGQYRRINVMAIKQGELIRFDPLAEEIEVNLIQDELVREKTPTIGYYAMFELVNGFKKAMYWPKEKMEAHALKYSKGYQAKKGYTFWEKDFDGMAYKTMLRQLISKWGVMSIDMQTAMINDMAAINNDGTPNYVDNSGTDLNETIEAEYIEKKPESVEQPTTVATMEDSDDAFEESFFAGGTI